MCRSDLGECVVAECTKRISCQDTGGYCQEHDPFNILFCDCPDDACVCEPVPQRPPDSRRKRVEYDTRQTEKALEQAHRKIAYWKGQHKHQLEMLAQLAQELRELN